MKAEPLSPLPWCFWWSRNFASVHGLFGALPAWPRLSPPLRRPKSVRANTRMFRGSRVFCKCMNDPMFRDRRWDGREIEGSSDGSEGLKQEWGWLASAAARDSYPATIFTHGLMAKCRCYSYQTCEEETARSTSIKGSGIHFVSSDARFCGRLLLKTAYRLRQLCSNHRGSTQILSAS